MNPHQRCLQAKVKNKNVKEPKRVESNSQAQKRSQEIRLIWTSDSEFPTIFNKTCTHMTFNSAMKNRQLNYGYPRGQTCPPNRGYHVCNTCTPHKKYNGDAN